MCVDSNELKIILLRVLRRDRSENSLYFLHDSVKDALDCISTHDKQIEELCHVHGMRKNKHRAGTLIFDDARIMHTIIFTFDDNILFGWICLSRILRHLCILNV